MGGQSSSTAASCDDCDSDTSCCTDNGEITCIDCLGILTEDGCGCKLSDVGIIVIVILVLCCLCGVASFAFYQCKKRNE